MQASPARPDARASPAGGGARPRLAWAIPLLSACLLVFHYAGLIAPGGFAVFDPAPLGLAFNSMALHLLAGRLDVDPGAIGIEAFVRDGRTYAYFGVFPALLRLPLAPFVDLARVHVERLSCLLAMLAGAGAQVACAYTALARADPPARAAMLPPLLFAACLSGPAIMLGRSGAIYYEAILWSWALAMLFVAAALGGLCGGRGFSTRRLALMALLAGMCLSTRVTTGLGLYVALGMLLLWRVPWRAGRARRALVTTSLLLPLGLLALFAALNGLINLGRWGSPFSFGDPRLQANLRAEFPQRWRVMDAYGAFNLLRLPIGLMYYVAPVWAWQPGGHYWMQDTILRLTAGMELPPSSVLLTDPLTLSLALAGLAHTIRARRPLASLGEAAPILAGLAVPAFLMLIFIGMNFRYRAEFEPLLVCGACLAAAGWSDRLRGAPPARLRRVAIVLGLLCALQVVSAELHSIVVLFSPFGQVEKAAPAGMFSYYGYELDLLRGVARGGRLGPI